MRTPAVHLDRFSSCDHLRGKKRNYAAVKAAALEAGRFSTFEASMEPGMFDHLRHDPEVELFDMGYPWIGVRRRGVPHV